jgi:hypothetical protein
MNKCNLPENESRDKRSFYDADSHDAWQSLGEAARRVLAEMNSKIKDSGQGVVILDETTDAEK